MLHSYHDMRILVLDDDEARHAKFSQWFAGEDVLHVYNINEFDNALYDSISDGAPWEAVFLDHDLNDFEYVSTERSSYAKELTGKDAVKSLLSLPEGFRPNQVFVHSWNPLGAMEMVKTLQDNEFNVTRWEFDPKADLKI